MKMIKTDKLVFEYAKRDEEGNIIGKSRAIDEVSLDIEPGQFIAILGHNGSGKSTLAKHMNALLVPSDGTMWVDGMDTKEDEHLWDDCCSKDGIGYGVDEHLSEKRLPFALLSRRGMAHRKMIQYVDESFRQMLLHDLIRRCGKANHIRS